MVLSAAQEARSIAADPAQPLARRRRWRGRPRITTLPTGDWPDLIARLLAMRGHTTEPQARSFLHTPLARPSAHALPDIGPAIDRLHQAAARAEQVAIFGDFDVDGVTSAAQLSEALRSLGAAPIPYIPDRFAEGYGLNIPAIERLRQDGATLLITADCGTSSVDEVARARAIGMDVIILDHHTVPPVLPDATAFVNPKLPAADAGDLSEMATAGLAFHVAAALHEAMGRTFDDGAYLDAAALGTICDMAPLAGENRRLVLAGLPAIARTRRPGLRALMDTARVSPANVSADDIGYRLGPRLNAAGRIEHANLALRLLMTTDDEEGRELALRLDALNRERQDRTAQAVTLATRIVEERGDIPPLIMAGHPDFSSGIVGLIASKLVSVYGRPAVVYEKGDRFSRASCRSIDDFHITDALRARPDLFVRFGGHRAAAGFSCETSRLDEVHEHLVAHAAQELAGRDLAPVLDIDAQFPLRDLKGDEIRWIMKLGPFGIGNPAPAFLARNLVVLESRVLGNGMRHLKLKLRDGGTVWPAIAFDVGDMLVEPGERIDAVYTLDARADGSLDIRIEDIRPAEQA
jgi:single-stranded-DNA-specific exonuclease